jgi:cytochrome c oxidase assembly protein subunit 15
VTLAARFSRSYTPGRAAQRATAVTILCMQAFIAVTGSVVRVTGSGLGCPTWPECFPGSMTPTPHPEVATLNQWIEYGNRMLFLVIGVAAAAAFVSVWLAHRTRPRRRYLWLAAAMPIGVVVQAVLGGAIVLTGLLWWTVGSHFLLSMVLVWLAVLLLRAVDEGDEPPVPLLPARLRVLPNALVAVMVLVLVAGVALTSAGPHAGDSNTPRLDLPIPTLATTHGALLVVLVILLIGTGLALRATAAVPRSTWRAYWVLIAAVLAQGALGSTQYELGVPEALVATHVLGAATVVVATGWFWTHTRSRGTRTP